MNERVAVLICSALDGKINVYTGRNYIKQIFTCDHPDVARHWIKLMGEHYYQDGTMELIESKL